MATRVLSAAGSLSTYVACDDAAVADWAEARGARVIWTPGLGLNGAVQAGVDAVTTAGSSRVIVAHADLPLATDLTWAAAITGAAIVPDRRDDGTNVISVPASCGFRFSYGPGSFRRHVAEAGRVGLACDVVRRDDLCWDVDVPADLAALPAP